MCSAAMSIMTPILGGIMGFGQNVASQQNQIESQYQQQMQVYQQQQLQHQQALANVEIGKRRTNDEARARGAEALLKYQQIQIAEQEANATATQQKMESAREIQRAQSLAKLSALEGNADGISADRMAVDMGFTLGQKFGAIETTRVSQIDQLQSEKMAAKLSAYTQPFYYYLGPEPTAPTKGKVNYGAAALSGLTGFIGSSGNFMSGLGTVANTCTPKKTTTSACNPCGTSSRFQ